MADTQHRLYRTVTLLGETTINVQNRVLKRKKETKNERLEEVNRE